MDSTNRSSAISAATIIEASLKGALPARSRLLVGVSGGKDSIALLDSLVSLQASIPLQALEVCHIDHRLRVDSRVDAELVREFATAHGLVFHLRTLDPFPSGTNIEAHARKLRYRAFAEILSTRALDWILTAHTQDDSVETALMRLVSGKELRGIAGCDPERRVLRPLLRVPRSVVDRYVLERSLPFRDDPTNFDSSRLRNKVRNLLIPFLEEHFPGDQRPILARGAQTVTELYELVDQRVVELITPLEQFPFGGREWGRRFQSLLQEAPAGARWRMVEQVLFSQIRHRIGQEHARRALQVFLFERVATQLPGGFTLRRSGGEFELSHSS